MPDVPDDAVGGRVENVMQGDGQLDRAEAGSEVPAARADGVDQELAQLGSELRQLGEREVPDCSRRLDALEQGIPTGNHGRQVYTRTRGGQVRRSTT